MDFNGEENIYRGRHWHYVFRDWFNDGACGQVEVYMFLSGVRYCVNG